MHADVTHRKHNSISNTYAAIIFYAGKRKRRKRKIHSSTAASELGGGLVCGHREESVNAPSTKCILHGPSSAFSGSSARSTALLFVRKHEHTQTKTHFLTNSFFVVVALSLIFLIFKVNLKRVSA